MRFALEIFKPNLLLTIFQHCIPLKANEEVDHTVQFYTNNIGRFRPIDTDYRY